MEYDYLAPDTVNEIFDALSLLEYFTGKSFYKKEKPAERFPDDMLRKKGKELLQNSDAIVDSLEIEAEGFENAKRKTILIKVRQAYEIFGRMISYYGMVHLVTLMEENRIDDVEALKKLIHGNTERTAWVNAGGQLIEKNDFEDLRKEISEEKIRSWEDLHMRYEELAKEYPRQKTRHAIASLSEHKNLQLHNADKTTIQKLLDELAETSGWITKKTYESRAKDYSSRFRKMVYANDAEMEEVLGKLGENGFICKQQQEMEVFRDKIALLGQRLR
jgi:hypothetical protein